MSGEPSVELPLDPRWQPMPDAHARLCQPIGNPHAAVDDLNTAMAENRLHCLRRYQTAPGVWACQLVSFLFWSQHRLTSWRDGLRIMVRPKPMPLDMCRKDRISELPARRVRFKLPGHGDGVLYAWRPDLERDWPNIFPPVVPGPLVEISGHLGDIAGHVGKLAQVTSTIHHTPGVAWPEQLESILSAIEVKELEQLENARQLTNRAIRQLEANKVKFPKTRRLIRTKILAHLQSRNVHPVSDE